MRDGVRTSEFYLTMFAQLISAVIPLLIIYGVVTQEQAAAWQALALAVAAVVIPLIVSWLAKGYTDNRTALKLSHQELERTKAELEAVRLERVQ